jgi:uncharacterized protein (DUF433 family)
MAGSVSLCPREWVEHQQEEGVMDWQDRIAVNPKVLVGKPVIKGTRIAVEFLMELLAEGWSHEQILKSYPQLTGEDIQAALHYATAVLKQERVYPLPV